MEGEASKEETKASINKKKVSHIIRRIQERHGTSRPHRGHKRKVEQKREKIEEESNLKCKSIIELDEGNDLNEEFPTPNNEYMSIPKTPKNTKEKACFEETEKGMSKNPSSNP